MMSLYSSFPNGSDSTESACNAGDPGSIPGLGRSPGEGNGYPLQYSCLENSMDRGFWWDIVHGVAKSWVAKSRWQRVGWQRVGHNWATFTSFHVTSLLFLEENVPNEETHEMGEFLMYSMNAQKNKFCDNVSKRNIQKDVELFITKN